MLRILFSTYIYVYFSIDDIKRRRSDESFALQRKTAT